LIRFKLKLIKIPLKYKKLDCLLAFSIFKLFITKTFYLPPFFLCAHFFLFNFYSSFNDFFEETQNDEPKDFPMSIIKNSSTAEKYQHFTLVSNSIPKISPLSKDLFTLYSCYPGSLRFLGKELKFLFPLTAKKKIFNLLDTNLF
jgi:hypothetical protein